MGNPPLEHNFPAPQTNATTASLDFVVTDSAFVDLRADSELSQGQGQQDNLPPDRFHWRRSAESADCPCRVRPAVAAALPELEGLQRRVW